MGWTFREYDETPAHEVFELLELWRLEADKTQ
jgi:hypothetical protein